MHRISYLVTLTIVFIFSINVFGQTVNYSIQQGSVDSGAVVNTGTFSDNPFNDETPFEKGIMNTEHYPEPIILDPQGAPVYESMYFEDTFHTDELEQVGENPLLITKFNQSLQNNVAPPDPTIAVGPNHVMVLTNNGTGIYIYDKQGNLLKSMSSTQWWSAVWPSQSGDPQVLYDHFSDRWVMVFMQVDDGAQTAGNLIAFSDDDDPIGTWYMYRLDTKMHGTTNSSTWGDYPQIGYDDKAIYIMTRLFGFTSGFFGTKIRIISKNNLYNGNAGPLTYTDLWNITIPGGASTPDVIHPTFNYTAANEHYFLHAPRSGGNYYSLYKLSDPIGNPVLTGTNIIVPFFGQTPNAGQLGTTTALESNGSHIKTSPVYKDGFLYATHSIRNSQHSAYGSVKYVKINTATNAVAESYELGAQGYYYLYPAIAVDTDDNIIITCSRSGDTEYPGAYFLGRRATDPPGLSNSFVLQEGLASYVCGFCGDRNRWGDYLGAYLDHSSGYDFWVVSQYAAATNTYAISIGNIRLKPFDGIYVFKESENLDFGNVEVGFSSDTLNVLIASYGTDQLTISDIPESVGDFHRVSSHSFPINLGIYDSLFVSFIFSPSSRGAKNEFYTITNNSTDFSGFDFSGFGYLMEPGFGQQLYAISGSQNEGKLLYIDKNTGTGTNIGPSGYSEFVNLSMNPLTGQIYGVISTTINSQIYRINSTLGDAYLLMQLDLPELFSLAFDTSGQLYGSTIPGEIYSIDLATESINYISTLDFSRVSIVFNPLNNQLWGSVKTPVGIRDRVALFDLASGDTLFVGRTGFGSNTNDLIFDEQGILYGIKGAPSTSADLFTIDQATGIGTITGSVGVSHVTGLGYSIDAPTSVFINEDLVAIPDEFVLTQNYPNPFNPNTTIKFSVPTSANIKLTVYNILGETVRVLFDKEFQSGNYSVVWNADDQTGRKVSSGVYFYELRAVSDKGSDFNQIRKMVLLK